MSASLITEVKQQWACMGDRLSALLMSAMALRLQLVDWNPIWPSFTCDSWQHNYSNHRR